MGKFNIELDIFKSGSINDLPHKGAASECYLSFNTGAKQLATLRVGTRDGDKIVHGSIKNGDKGLTHFVELRKENINTSTIELPDDDPNLSVAFSIYYGSRAFDITLVTALLAVISAEVGAAAGIVAATLPIGAGVLLSVANKELLGKAGKLLVDQVKGVVLPVGIGKIQQIGASVKQVIPIYSMIDNATAAFPEDLVVSVGDLVGNITLTKV